MKTVDVNKGLYESQIAKNLKKSMEKTLYGNDRPQCCVEGCIADAMPNTAYCRVHWQEKLDREAKEQVEQDKKRRKEFEKIAKSPKLQAQQVLEQRLQAWFNTHRVCDICGHFCLKHEDGFARLKKVNPKLVGWPEIGPNDHAYEIVCKMCEKKGY
jgi:hypothetical protein